jgi:general secretion pathway protein N
MIRRGMILGLAAAVAFGHLQGRALAVTEPADPDLSGSRINAPFAAPEAAPLKPAGPVAAGRPLTGNPLWGVPLSTLSETRERPIFSPSRRPPAPAVVAAPDVPPVVAPAKPAEPDHPLLALMGTVVGETESVGVFLDQATNDFVRLKTGQDHHGWILRSLREREATFERKDLTATLSLPAPGGPEQASRPVLPYVAGLQPAGNTWVDGDGQTISPPPGKTPAPRP